MLYKLNTDPSLNVEYDPSNIVVKKGVEYEPSRIPSRVSYSDWNNWSVFGSVLVNKRDDGSYHIYDDKYDYDIRGDYLKNPQNIIRDIETIIGTPGYNGTPFYFKFNRDKEIIYEKDN